MRDLIARRIANASMVFALSSTGVSNHNWCCLFRRIPESCFETSLTEMCEIKLSCLYEWWLQNSMSSRAFIISAVTTSTYLFAFYFKLRFFIFVFFLIRKQLIALLGDERGLVNRRHYFACVFFFLLICLDRWLIILIPIACNDVNDWFLSWLLFIILLFHWYLLIILTQVLECWRLP